ncbi:type II toxin-antitoxin system RelE/ParE family toxin [Candidatus Woesearchaeota archaeon]|nr:type II toxin-antitoxin system RelE/ParE family toxin [Candidatus Woesearchaeota archaeon]
MYSIEFSASSEKFLRKLPKETSENILNKIYSIRHEPFRYLARLAGTNLWKLRIGKYRAELDILIKNRIIFVVRIGHRRNIYSKAH